MKHVKPPCNVSWAFQPTRLDLHQSRVKGQLLASRLDPDGFRAWSWGNFTKGRPFKRSTWATSVILEAFWSSACFFIESLARAYGCRVHFHGPVVPLSTQQWLVTRKRFLPAPWQVVIIIPADRWWSPKHRKGPGYLVAHHLQTLWLPEWWRDPRGGGTPESVWFEGNPKETICFIIIY